MLRTLLITAKTTPKALLNWDIGILPIKLLIEQRKLMFIHHLIKLPEKSLATQIYDQQKDLDFLGLVKECKDLIQYYNLLDTTNTMSLKEPMVISGQGQDQVCAENLIERSTEESWGQAGRQQHRKGKIPNTALPNQPYSR